MSDDSDSSQKTEDPSSKRLDDAHESGQVANSREVNNLFMILAMTLTVILFAGGMARDIVNMSMPFIENPDQIPTDLGHLTQIGWKLFGMLLIAGAVPIILSLFAAFGAGYLQFGLVWSGEQLMPKLNKISPLAGLKRMFSLRALSEFLKGILKIVVVASVAWFLLSPMIGGLHKLIGMDMVQLVDQIQQMVRRLLIGVFSVMAAIAVFDVIYQRYEHTKQLRMSRQELKDEMKETEGDPLIKGRLRQLRIERARKRMMSEVPKADVVVTNPTHYAVALKYDQEKMAAPRVVAKGVDKVAQKIRAVAEEHKIPIIENPPLARGLFAAVEVDQEIPAEYYKAVAELIGYIYRLKRKRL